MPTSLQPATLGSVLAHLGRRRWREMLALWSGAMLAVAAITARQPKLYAAVALLDLPEHPQPAIRFRAGSAGVAAPEDHAVATTAGLLRGRDLAAATLARMRARDRAWLGCRAGAVAPAAISAFESHLRLGAGLDSRLIRLQFTAPSPQQAARIANLLVATFRRRRQAAARARLAGAEAALAARLVLAREKLSRDGDTLWRMLGEMPSGFAASALATSQPQALAAWNQALVAAELRQLDLEADPSAAEIGPWPPNELIAGRASAEAEVKRLAAKYRPQALPLIMAQRRLAALNQAVAAWRAHNRRRFRARLRLRRARSTELRRAYRQQERRWQMHSREAVRVARLDQRVQAESHLYARLYARRAELQAQAALTPPPLRIADGARPLPAPLQPNWPLSLAMGNLLAAAFALAGGLTIERAGDRIAAGDPRLAGLPLLNSMSAGVLPAVRIAQGLRQAKHLLIIGVEVGGGETAWNLGQALAGGGTAVLLVDADWLHPDLHRRASVPQTPGLAETLVATGGGAAFIRDLLQPAPLHLLTAGQATNGFGGAPERIAKWLGQARQGYDLVIVATSSRCWDWPLFANAADAIVLVAPRRSSRRKIVQLLEQMHGLPPLLGLFLPEDAPGTNAGAGKGEATDSAAAAA